MSQFDMPAWKYPIDDQQMFSDQIKINSLDKSLKAYQRNYLADLLFISMSWIRVTTAYYVIREIELQSSRRT